MVKGFSKMYNFSFYWQIFFCKHFYYVTVFCDYKFNFCKFANFFADSKSSAQELSINVSFVIFGHQTWDLEGGGQIYPPPTISWFSSTPAEIGLTAWNTLKLKSKVVYIVLIYATKTASKRYFLNEFYTFHSFSNGINAKDI